jgi:hypothetical protein
MNFLTFMLMVTLALALLFGGLWLFMQTYALPGMLLIFGAIAVSHYALRAIQR